MDPSARTPPSSHPPVLQYAHPAPRPRPKNDRAANAFLFALIFPIFTPPLIMLATYVASFVSSTIGNRLGWVLGVMTGAALVACSPLFFLRDAIRGLREIGLAGEGNRRQAIVAVVVHAIYLTLVVLVAGAFVVGAVLW